MCRKHANDMHSSFFIHSDQPAIVQVFSKSLSPCLTVIGDQDLAISLPKWIADLV